MLNPFRSAPALSPQAQTAFRIAVVTLSIAVIIDLYGFFLYWQLQLTLSAVAAEVLLGFCALAALSVALSRLGYLNASMGLLIAGLIALFPATSALIAGVGLYLGIALVFSVAAIAGWTLSRRWARNTILVGVAGGLAALLIDLYWPYPRLTPPDSFREIFAPLLTGLIVAAFGVLVARQFPRYRLSTKLLVGFLAVALVPLTIASVLNDRASRNTLTTTANQVLYTAALQTGFALDAFVNAGLDAVTAEAESRNLRDYMRLAPDERAGSEAEALVKQELLRLGTLRLSTAAAAQETRIVDAYLVIDKTWRVVISNLPPEEQRLTNFPENAFFATPLETGEPYISPIYFGDPDEQGRYPSSLYFSAPIRDEMRNILGVLVAEVNTAWFQRILIQNAGVAGRDSFAVLFNEDGLRLIDGAAQGTNVGRFPALPEVDTLVALRAFRRIPNRPTAELDAGLPDLAASLRRAQAGEPVAYFNGTVHFAANPLSNEPRHLAALVPLQSRPWTLMFAQPESVALIPAQAQTQTAILLFVAIAIAVSGVSALAARNLTRPISRLTQVAERVTEGELTARVRPEADDEIGALASTFNMMTTRLQQTLNELEQRVEQRTAQLQAAAEIGRATAGVRDLAELLELAVELIRGRFGFYHASVFLMDEAGEYAVLRESTGEIGAQLKARGHRLAVGSRSLVGWVTQNRKLRVARDVAGDPFHFKNPLLPETRSELCMPLIVGDRLIGALDAQSKELDAFSESDQQALQVLADQLSVAIENAQLFQRTQTALSEVQAQYQQTVSAAGQAALGGQPREMVFDLEPGGAVSETPVTVPLRLRGQTIGVIELHGRPASTPLTAEEQAVLETIAVQLSTAIESTALLQESQRRSRRDHLITEITDQMRATLNPTAILQSGLRQLGKALGATDAIVKLQPKGGNGDDDEPGKTA